MNVAEVQRMILSMKTPFTLVEAYRNVYEAQDIDSILIIVGQALCFPYTGKYNRNNDPERTILSPDERKSLCPKCNLQNKGCEMKPGGKLTK